MYSRTPNSRILLQAPNLKLWRLKTNTRLLTHPNGCCRYDSFDLIKCGAVAVCIGGVVLMTLGDLSSSTNSTAGGGGENQSFWLSTMSAGARVHYTHPSSGAADFYASPSRHDSGDSSSRGWVEASTGGLGHAGSMGERTRDSHSSTTGGNHLTFNTGILVELGAAVTFAIYYVLFHRHGLRAGQYPPAIVVRMHIWTPWDFLPKAFFFGCRWNPLEPT
jgi:drug/metabolite transporter (DMT)-like permease